MSERPEHFVSGAAPFSFTSRKPLGASEAFVPKSYFLITAGTFQKRPFIHGDGRKQMLLESLDFNSYKWKWRLLAYVILDNHYHLVVQTPPADTSRMAHIIQSAHSFSAYHWRRDDPSIHSRIWWNFWDSPIEDMEKLRLHINYLHRNPQFHGKGGDPAEYGYSSYRMYLEADAGLVEKWEAEYPANRLAIIDSF